MMKRDWDTRWRILSTLPESMLDRIVSGDASVCRDQFVTVARDELGSVVEQHEPFFSIVWMHRSDEEPDPAGAIAAVRQSPEIMNASVPIVVIDTAPEESGALGLECRRMGAVQLHFDETDAGISELLVITSALVRHRSGNIGLTPYLKDLHVRLMYQAATNECTRLFIGAGDSTEALRSILVQIRIATRSSSAYVFENYCDIVKGPCARMFVIDTDPGISDSTDQRKLLEIQYSAIPSELSELLSSGRSIARSIDHGSIAVECPFLGNRPIGSCLFVPLFVGKVFWGFVGFERPLPYEEWTEIDIESIGTLLSVYVAMLERMLLDRLAATQRNLAIDLSAATDIDTALKLSLKAARHSVGFESGGIYVVDHASRDITLKYAEGISESFLARVSRYTFDSFEGGVVLSGQSRYVNIGELLGPQINLMRSEGFISIVNIPIRHLGEVIACLNLASKTYLHVPDFLRKGLEAIAYQIGVALARIAVEEKLRQSDAHLRSIMTHSKDLIFLCDREGRYRFVSAASRTILGCAPEQLIGKPLAFVHPDDAIAMKKHFDEAFERPSGVSVEYRIVRESGECRWVSQSWAPLAAADSEPMLVGIMRDITDAKEAYEQLHQSMKMEAIGRLAGGVAHEFNNMLTGILGYASLLKNKPNLDTSVMNAVRTIEKAAEQAAQLTRQLLGFARKGKYQTIPVDLHASIQEVLALLRWTISKDIKVIERLNARNCVVMGDPTQIQQVVLNLAVNACESMRQGGTMLLSTVQAVVEPTHPRTTEGLKPGNYILLTVSDTGSGIDPQHLPHIFEPFFTTKEQTSGTGMGLAMVYGIVKNHAGCIYVDSKVGHGTTFSVFFPRNSESRDREVEDDSGEIIMQSGTVMLVDDDQLIRETAESLLQTLGFTTIVFADGHSAASYFRDHHRSVDIVILDMVMPEFTGLECFRELKRINPGAHVLISTGYSLEGKAAELREEGVCGFIQKPYTLKQISAILDQSLKMIRPESQA